MDTLTRNQNQANSANNSYPTMITRPNRLLLKLHTIACVFFLTLSFVGCTLISAYSETAYRQSTSLKAASLRLMSKANEPYEQHAKAVEKLLLQAEQAYEYARLRPKNLEASAQWAALIDPERNLLAGYFKRWAASNNLEPFFIQEAKAQISSAFDIISTLEIAKK